MKKAIVLIVLICFLMTCFAMVGCSKDDGKTAVKKAPAKKTLKMKSSSSGKTMKPKSKASKMKKK